MIVRCLFLLILCLSILPTINASEVAKVIRVRGYASQLSPGAKEARVVLLGQKIFEDTSVLTKPKSLVVIEFNDGARMTIGPDSKLVVTKARGEGPGLVSLLKGKMRSTVKPDNTKEDKYFIRTRTAAMGVRGTDFQTSFNPENRSTSLVTFKGQVMMARLDTPQQELEATQENINVTRDENNRASVEQSENTRGTRIQELKKILASKDVVSVSNGQYAGAVTGLSKPTQPVVISPVQLNLLYKSDELAPKRESEKLDDLALKEVKHVGNPEGYYDARQEKFAPRAGGFVDLDSALYIPPNENSELDPRSNTYTPKNMGFIDKSTGDYVAPKGLILDPKLGFVPKTNSSELLAQAGALNRTIAKDVLLKDINEVAPVIRPNKRERIERANVWFAFGASAEQHSVSNNSAGLNFDQDSQSVNDFELGYDHPGKDNWQALTRISLRSVDLENNQLVNAGSKSLWSVGAGARTALSPRLGFSSLLSLDQIFIYNRVTNNNVTSNEWSRFTIPTLEFVLESEFFRTNRFAMIADGGLLINLPKSRNDVEVKAGAGFLGRIGAEYWLGSQSTLSLSYMIRAQSFELESTRFTAQDDVSRSGLNLKLQYFY